VDPERWPTKIREIVDALECPRCGEKKRGAKGIFVRTRLIAGSQPVWAMLCECWQCGLEWSWQISPNSPEGAEHLQPLPEPVRAGDVIQPPNWWQEIGKA
jgi:hypothetical protein